MLRETEAEGPHYGDGGLGVLLFALLLSIRGGDKNNKEKEGCSPHVTPATIKKLQIHPSRVHDRNTAGVKLRRNDHLSPHSSKSEAADHSCPL
eukprot:gene14818-biopygen409